MDFAGRDTGREPGSALSYQEAPPRQGSAESVIAPDGLVRPLSLHRHFILFSAGVFSLLMAETGWYAAVRYGHGTAHEVLAHVGLNSVTAFAGFVLAFAAAPRLYQRLSRAAGERVVVQLMKQWAWIAAILSVFSTIIAISYVPLASGSLAGTFLLLRSCFLYALLGSAAPPGMVLFVIYVRYLREHGMDDRYKIFGVCATLAVLLLVVILRFLNFDARPDLTDIALIDSIHNNAGSLLLLAGALTTYLWAVRWIADH
jgi:hypothetical protein